MADKENRIFTRFLMLGLALVLVALLIRLLF